MRRKASDEWRDANPYKKSKSWVGPEGYELPRFAVSDLLNRVSHGHDADFEDEEKPYTQFGPADAKWIKNTATNWWEPARAIGNAAFRIKGLAFGGGRSKEPIPRVPENLRWTGESEPRSPKTTKMAYTGRKRKGYKGMAVRARVFKIPRGLVLGGFKPRYPRMRSMTLRHQAMCIEKKNADCAGTAVTSTSATQTAAVFPLTENPIAIGAQRDQRIGDRIWIWGIGLNFRIQPTLTTVGPFTLRMLLVVDRQANATSNAQLDDILSNDSTAADDTNMSVAFRNLANVQRYGILFDKEMHFHPNTVAVPATSGTTGTAVYSYNMKQWDYYKSFKKPIEVQYPKDGDGTTVAKNNLLLFLFGTSSSCNVIYAGRVRYTD